MSTTAAEFVQAWIEQNIHPEAYVDEEGDNRPAEHAASCMRDAEAAGISRGEVDEEFGNLEDVMAQAMGAAVDSKFKRAVIKDA